MAAVATDGAVAAAVGEVVDVSFFLVLFSFF